MGKEKLNSRALVERDAKIGSAHKGIFRILDKFKSVVGELVVIQVYAPTTEAQQPECDSFYSLLQATISEQKDGDFVILVHGRL